MGSINPKEFHHEAEASVGAKGGIAWRGGKKEPVVKALPEQPEPGATHKERTTRSIDKEKACGFEFD